MRPHPTPKSSKLVFLASGFPSAAHCDLTYLKNLLPSFKAVSPADPTICICSCWSGKRGMDRPSTTEVLTLRTSISCQRSSLNAESSDHFMSGLSLA